MKALADAIGLRALGFRSGVIADLTLSVCSGQIIVATLERLKWVGYRLLDILVAYRPGAVLQR
jgi:hypothetical protein